jgi:hypothetical protein
VSAPMIRRVGEVLPPAAAPTRPAHRAATSPVRHVADLGEVLRYFPGEPPRDREPSHRATESFEAVFEREMAACGYSLSEYLSAGRFA